MEKNYINPKPFKELSDDNIYKESDMLINETPYEWNIWNGCDILRTATIPEDTTNYIHFESIRDIKKKEDMRSIIFREGEGHIDRFMILVEHIHQTPLLNYVLSCF